MHKNKLLHWYCFYYQHYPPPKYAKYIAMHHKSGSRFISHSRAPCQIKFYFFQKPGKSPKQEQPSIRARKQNLEKSSPFNLSFISLFPPFSFFILPVYRFIFAEWLRLICPFTLWLSAINCWNVSLCHKRVEECYCSTRCNFVLWTKNWGSLRKERSSICNS